MNQVSSRLNMPRVYLSSRLLVLIVICHLISFSNCMPKPLERTDYAEPDRRDNFDERGSFVEGDMILQPGMVTRAGIIGEIFRWPNATVVYQIDKDFTEDERDTILEAFETIESETCISFKEHETEAGYVFIARGGDNSGCWSLVGRLGLVQQLNLQSPGCVTKGIVMHELIHAIGFYHEQSREDRDDYVTINWDNIELGKESNFYKPLGGSLTYNVTYDYGSLMHYSAYSFAKNSSEPTIIPLDDSAVIGQRLRLSEKDSYKVNAMYCPDEGIIY